ncbi:MAG TPA: hypothetical protein P5195_10325, partial [Anaerolineae bacterium]|nr:hypothetical protein [Anaerolineae bacterium]
ELGVGSWKLEEKTYPDISELLAAKQARRRALAALSWEEKVAIMERMRRLLPNDAWTDKNALQSEGRVLKGAADGED